MSKMSDLYVQIVNAETEYEFCNLINKLPPMTEEEQEQIYQQCRYKFKG